MATLKQIRQRIKTAKNIRQITRAMKLVSAARLKKAQDKVLEARPYADKMREFMASLGAAGELPQHPLLAKRPIQNYAVIIVTAERGLAGSYNTNLIKASSDFLKKTDGKASLFTVGKKGSLFFGKRGYNMVGTHTIASSGATFEDAVKVTKVATDLYTSGEVDAVFVVYAKFYSAIRQVPQVVQLLPIEPPKAEGEVASATSSSKEYSYEPAPVDLLKILLPRFVLTVTFQALLESTASEFGARMTAMTSATDNAAKMIDGLTLKANRERQASITKEILEVVGGAEALKG